MGEVVKLNNAVVVDQETVSELWYALYTLGDGKVLDRPLSEFHELQEHARFVCLKLTEKMVEQDCALSSEIAYGYQSDWENLVKEGDFDV
jgi:hypothetical protein